MKSGNAQWRKRLVPFIVGVAAVDTDPKEPIDEKYVRDGYGGIAAGSATWHLEKPPLNTPSFDVCLSVAGIVLPPRVEGGGAQDMRSFPDSFLIGNLGWGLFECSGTCGASKNILMDAVAEPDFFEEVLDRLMRLYLAFVEYTAELPVEGFSSATTGVTKEA